MISLAAGAAFRLPWPGPLRFFFFCVFFVFFSLFRSVPFAVGAPDVPDLDLPNLDDLPDDLPVIPSAMLEGFTLLMLKDGLGNPQTLSSWTHGDPCNKTHPWAGVFCTGGMVTALRLGGMNLSGTLDGAAVDILGHLEGLRSLGISDNDFYGKIPPLSPLIALKSLFLSNNRFSGHIDDDFFFSMTHLKKVWLAGNSFSGEIPSSLSKLSHLMELHLENNQFSGQVPPIDVPTLRSFNLSNNQLEGVVPAALRKFDASAFNGNPGLCFPQPGKDCSSAAAGVSGGTPSSDSAEVRSWRATIVGVVLTILFLALLAGVFIIKKRRRGAFDTLGVEHGAMERGSGHSASAAAAAAAPSLETGAGPGGLSGRGDASERLSESSRKGSSHGKNSDKSAEAGLLVMLNQDKGTLALPDLMKSAAELLASNAVCSTYKVLLPSGAMVAVKRLRALNNSGEHAFEAELRRLGRLRHRNVLPPLAYHYGEKERLLVFDYFDKGSLNYALHGDRGPYHAGLTWVTRLRIVKGIARGMAYLHAELAGSELPHGNLKSSNVILGPDYEPLLADYGLAPLLDPSQLAAAMAAHRSPEVAQRRQISPKADVYCLGVVVLEVITGKFPSQYWSGGTGGTDVVAWAVAAVEERREAELVDPEIFTKRSMAGMERLVRIGAACADPKPENRPTMKEAARRIEAVTVEDPAAGSEDDAVAAAAALKEGHAVLTTRLSARERNVESFGIS